MKAILSAEAETQIQFHHLDPMDIVWHGNHSDFFELARVELMDMINYGYPEMKASGYGWPVIELKVRYARPMRWRMKIIVRADLVEWENRLKIKFTIRDAATGDKLCSGHTVQVAVDTTTGEMQWEAPAILREKLEPFL
ncbi:MAG: 4-hydroxybenzoyl-CoA thioesterase [Ponticaulis sp.]|nr:4-hydroxybenzoyl-CoA thioesterase [Ponticaulis sp.]